LKKIICLILVLVSVLTLVSCGSKVDVEALSQQIAGKTWTGSTKTVSETTSTTASKSVVTYKWTFSVTFNSDGTCTAKMHQEISYDKNYVVEDLRGTTKRSDDEYICKWDVKAKGNGAVVTLTSEDFLGMIPHKYTLTLDENGNITGISGTNGTNDPVDFMPPEAQAG